MLRTSFTSSFETHLNNGLEKDFLYNIPLTMENLVALILYFLALTSSYGGLTLVENPLSVSSNNAHLLDHQRHLSYLLIELPFQHLL